MNKRRRGIKKHGNSIDDGVVRWNLHAGVVNGAFVFYASFTALNSNFCFLFGLIFIFTHMKEKENVLRNFLLKKANCFSMIGMWCLY